MPPAELRRQGPTPPTTKSYRGWSGMNLADSRLSLQDDELAWCDNAMVIGRELQVLPIYNGPRGDVIYAGAPIKQARDVYLTYGAFTEPHACAILIFGDGAAYMRDFIAGTDTLIGAAGTFSDSTLLTSIAMFRDGPVLILDQTTGYWKWDGVTLTLIDGAVAGDAIAVFEDRAWLVTGTPRTISVTAPTTFDDFNPANGAVVTRLTDDVFTGRIIALYSTVQQLWVIGDSAVNAIGSVQTVAGVTTFSNTNAVKSIGTIYSDSISGYFRLLTFAAPDAIHGLLGVTPQYLSAKISRLFGDLAPIRFTGPRPGLVKLNGQMVLAWLYDYNDPIAQRHRSLLVCFSEGKWFVASPPELDGARILDMVSILLEGRPELYGIDDQGRMYRIFARPTDAMAGQTGIFFKLDDFGGPVQGHHAILAGLDLVAPLDVATADVALSVVSEKSKRGVSLGPVAFAPDVDQPTGQRFALVRTGLKTQDFAGQRIGVSLVLQGADRLSVAGVHVQIDTVGEWLL